jgi:hypothetical protein
MGWLCAQVVGIARSEFVVPSSSSSSADWCNIGLGIGPHTLSVILHTYPLVTVERDFFLLIVGIMNIFAKLTPAPAQCNSMKSFGLYLSTYSSSVLMNEFCDSRGIHNACHINLPLCFFFVPNFLCIQRNTILAIYKFCMTLGFGVLPCHVDSLVSASVYIAVEHLPVVAT